MAHRRIMVAASLALASGAAADVVIGNFGAGVGTGTIFGTTSTTVYKAAGWTMGAQGYRLTEVKLTLSFAGQGTGIFTLWTGTGTPQSQVTELNGPPQTGAGDFSFTPATSMVMEPGQTYWVYVQSIPSPTGNFLWQGTSPTTEPTGAAATSAGFVFNGNPSTFRNRFEVHGAPLGGCYPNCDQSTSAPILNVQDFTCFLQRYAAGESYANCDDSTSPPVLNVQDFTCFLQRYAAGCP
jgi:hypothetical protein